MLKASNSNAVRLFNRLLLFASVSTHMAAIGATTIAQLNGLGPPERFNRRKAWILFHVYFYFLLFVWSIKIPGSGLERACKL